MTPIYTDKEYLDEQFRQIHSAILSSEVRTNLRIDDHNHWHQRWGKRLSALALAIIGGAGWLWPKP